MKNITLTFNNITATVYPNEDGMYDLNDIHRAFKLPNSKLPHQWRHRVRDSLSRRAKLRFGVSTSPSGHRLNHTWATQEALYAYAMWCDVEFYMVVVNTFTALTNGDIEKAQEIAQTVVSVHEQRATELYLQGQRGGHAMRKALEELNGDVDKAIELMDRIAREFPSTATTERDAYWTSVSTVLKHMADDYRVNTKHFDLTTYGKFETLRHHCTKRLKCLAKFRLTKATKHD
ncbi:MAG: hypothetical protein Sw1PiTSA_14570 [Shewanella algae]|jgi:hypothetical protein|uniref:KilA-N domain n=1 Tax=Shewanella algae TaxID=38313 RepID=A0A380BIX7_9GAMM|nr:MULTISPECIES: KilA-N domain-containing protein [Shewanella]MBO2608234.1 KilA-N domain-containing protein [Shewanella algae]PSS72479.1 hypothetical protein AYI88_11995 [Shewanella algae]TVP00706.1 hypothetical protein AYI73_21370 [Shewanella algae]SUJ02000.1 KilA-N domain [Shewanella algae]BCV41360.1 hypothetical protein TUM17378_26220 [Shewanella algae]